LGELSIASSAQEAAEAFFSAGLVECFFSVFLAGWVAALVELAGVALAAGAAGVALVAGAASVAGVAGTALDAGVAGVAGVAANVRPEPNRPAAMHRAVILDFMMIPLIDDGCCVGLKPTERDCNEPNLKRA
jgi:hypothetical protein